MSIPFENLTRITRYEPLGELPNPFVFDSGAPVQSPEQWPFRRAEMLKTAVTLQYGEIPPAPEVLTVEPLYGNGPGSLNTYRVITGPANHPVSFTMVAFLPESGKCPAVITGDLCFGYAFNRDYIDAFTRSGVALVMFNRTELVPDMFHAPSYHGPMHDAYPEVPFTALGAWAWGYSRCVDALEKLDIVDMDSIVFTGHSRGGKTAVLAGILDERAIIVNPNESGCGGCGCYRLNAEILCEDGKTQRNETLADMTKNFPHWLNPAMNAYIGREQELPFDKHFTKALIAPRVLFLSEAASDAWANPVGSWQTTMAAKEVFKFLGCENNLIWYYRPGTHAHAVLDVEQLVKVIRHVKNNAHLNDNFFKTPFETPEPMFGWKCP